MSRKPSSMLPNWMKILEDAKQVVPAWMREVCKIDTHQKILETLSEFGSNFLCGRLKIKYVCC